MRLILTNETVQENIQTEYNSQNTAKQNYPGSVTSYDTRPRNEVGLFYVTVKPTSDTMTRVHRVSTTGNPENLLEFNNPPGNVLEFIWSSWKFL